VRAGLKVKGNQTLAGLKRTLHEMPLTVAASVADRAEPVLTRETRGAFSSGRTVYGEPRPGRSFVAGSGRNTPNI
jgi:Glu-tRNA(Gln) amidotransferase subunit E-like FAD-binding protein